MTTAALRDLVTRLSPDARRRLAEQLRARHDAAALGSAPATLVAYYVSASGDELPVHTLRALVGATLPAHFVPSLFRRVSEIPRTVHGKVDAAALPSPIAVAASSIAAREVTQSDTEVALLAIWASVLGIKRIAPTDSFFELGGDSLLAIRLLGQIRDRWSIDLSMTDLFDAPTVSGAAARIDAVLWARSAPVAPSTEEGDEREELVF